jgi:long-chain acyl-CoA synthetase
MSEEKLWKESWDEGIDDLNPQLSDTNFVDAAKPVFEKYPDN